MPALVVSACGLLGTVGLRVQPYSGGILMFLTGLATFIQHGISAEALRLALPFVIGGMAGIFAAFQEAVQ